MADKGSPSSTSPHHVHTIFVDTSIDTHLALMVSLHDTIGDVKRKIRAEHAFCFQDIGEITIQAIKVKRRGFFYNLADSMFVLNAFDGVKGSWFVCIDAVPEYAEHRDYAVPVCGVEKHQETSFCGLSPKNQDSLINDQYLSMVMPAKSVEPENQNSLDASVKEFPVHDCPSLQIGICTPAQGFQVCSTAVLVPGDGSIKALNGLKVSDGYLHECVSQCEPKKYSGPDGVGSPNPVVTSIDCVHRLEMLINQGKDGRRKKETKNLGFEARDFMPSSTCTHKTRSKKIDSKSKNGLHEEHREDCRKGSKFSRRKDNDESSRSANLSPEINCDEKMEILAIPDGLPSKLPHANTTSLKNPPVDKHTKKRCRKSTKSHESAHLAMPCEVKSTEVTANAHNLGKESITSDTRNLLEVANQKEIDLSTETCLNIEINEVQTLQVNSIDPRINHVNLGEESNLGVIFEGHGGEAEISPQQSPTMLSLSNDILKIQSSKVFPHKEANNHQNAEFCATKCITELNVRGGEAGSTDAKEQISLSPEKFASQEQVSNAVSNDSLTEKFHDLYKETEATANPNGANTSKRSRKMSKTESSRVFHSPIVNVNEEPFNVNGARVILTDIQNESNATIFSQQGDQKVNGGHDLDTMMECSTSSKKLASQDHALHMNSDNPLISLPHNSSKPSSKAVKKAAGIKAPPQQAQAKEHRSRKKSKSDHSKIYSSEISDVVLSRFNGDVVQSNKERGSSASRVDNAFNQKIELRCIDAKVTAPLSHEDFPTLLEVHQVNPLDYSMCKPQDLGGQTNAKIVSKQNNATQCGVLAGLPTSKRDRRKSKKEVSEAQGSSEMSEHLVVAESDDGKSDPSKLDNMFTQKMKQHCIDANVTVPLSHEDLPALVKVQQVNPLDSSSCKTQDLSAQTGAELVAKQSDVTEPGDLLSLNKSKRVGKKSKKEVLEAQISSEMSEHLVVAELNERSDPLKLDNTFNQKMEQHCIDARVMVPLSHENFSTPERVLQRNPLHSSNCKSQDLSGLTNAKILAKENDVSKHIDFASPTKYMHERKKPKMEVLEARVSSEKSEHLELHREFIDYFVPKEGKHCRDVHAEGLPSRKSKSRRKHKSRGKTDVNQPYQDSPSNLVQSDSHKQHEATGQIQVNVVDTSQDDMDKDSKTGNVLEVIKTKKSSKLKLSLGRIKSDSSLHTARDKQKRNKKRQDYGPQSHVQLLKSGDIQRKEEKITTTDRKGESQCVQYKDLYCSTTRNPKGYSLGYNNFDVFHSEGVDNEEASSDSTEDNPDMRYRLVRKNQSRSSKKIINSNLEKLASPGRRFSDVSGASSDSGSGSYKNKSAIRTGLDSLCTYEDLDTHLEEVKTKANALKLQTDAGASDTESNRGGEDGKDVSSKVIEDHSRSSAFTRKVPLSAILKSSSIYKKARMTASQSEFVEYAESQQLIGSQPEP